MLLTLNADVSEIASPQSASIGRGLVWRAILWAASECELVNFSVVTWGQQRRIRAQLEQQWRGICHVISPECRRERDLRMSISVH